MSTYDVVQDICNTMIKSNLMAYGLNGLTVERRVMGVFTSWKATFGDRSVYVSSAGEGLGNVVYRIGSMVEGIS